MWIWSPAAWAAGAMAAPISSATAARDPFFMARISEVSCSARLWGCRGALRRCSATASQNGGGYGLRQRLRRLDETEDRHHEQEVGEVVDREHARPDHVRALG